MEPAIICRSTSPVIVCQGFQDQAARVSIKEETVDAKKKLWSFFPRTLPPPSSSFPLSFFTSVYFSYFPFPPSPPSSPSPSFSFYSFYYKFSPITPSPSSPHFSSVFYSFFLFLLFLSLVFLLRRPSFPSVSCQPPFPLFFHYLLHYPPSHLYSSPLISTVSFCFSHFPIFFVSLILFEFPLFFCLEVDYCYDSPCLNNGTCRSLLNNYTCACTEQFQGKNCEG